MKEFDSISLKYPWIAWNANNWCYHSNSVELGVFMCLSSWRAEKSSTDMKCWFERQWIYFMSTTWDLWCNLNVIWWAEPPCSGLDWLFFKSLFYEISVLESSFLSDLERRGRFLLQFSSEAAEGCKYLLVLILSLGGGGVLSGELRHQMAKASPQDVFWYQGSCGPENSLGDTDPSPVIWGLMKMMSNFNFSTNWKQG